MTLLASKRHEDGARRYRRAAVVSLLAVTATIYVAFFWQGVPVLQSHDEIRGVFSTANQLRKDNPVRLAGIDIGRVTAIEKGPDNTSIVTMRLDHMEGVHADASLKIEPRLFFEGNFAVKVTAGTPSAPPLRSGATIPLDRTAVPVQLDQVLNVFDAPMRDELNSTLKELADGLGRGSRGASGYGGLRRATRELDGALHSFQQIARAARGTHAGDLHRAVGSFSDTTAQIAQNPAALADMVTNFDRVSGALAANDQALAAAIRELDGVMRSAPRSLAALEAALPVVTRFADALRPALHATPVTMRKTNRLLAQVARLVRPRELPALLHSLEPVSSNLPTLERRLGELLGLVTAVGRCVADVVVPALNKQVPDGKLSTGDPAWLDLMHMGTNAIGAGPSTDANGTTIRLGVAGGEQTLQGFLPGVGNVVASGEIEGVRPTWLGYGVDMPWRPDQPCHEQKLPDLGARSGGPPKWLRPGPPRNRQADGDAQRLIRELFTAGPEALLRRLLRRLPQTEKATRPAVRPRPGTAPDRALPQPAVAVRPPKVPDVLPSAPVIHTPNGVVDKLLKTLRRNGVAR